MSKPLDSLCLFHILCRLPCSIYLHSCLQVSVFSPQDPTDMSLFAWISHFLFGVCFRALVLVPNTHQTLLTMRKRGRNGNTDKEYKWEVEHKYRGMGEGCVWREWGWVYEERRLGKFWLMTRTTKGKRTNRHKIVNYAKMQKWRQMMSELLQNQSLWVAFTPYSSFLYLLCLSA